MSMCPTHCHSDGLGRDNSSGRSKDSTALRVLFQIGSGGSTQSQRWAAAMRSATANARNVNRTWTQCAQRSVAAILPHDAHGGHMCEHRAVRSATTYGFPRLSPCHTGNTLPLHVPNSLTYANPAGGPPCFALRMSRSARCLWPIASTRLASGAAGASRAHYLLLPHTGTRAHRGSHADNTPRRIHESVPNDVV